MNFIEWKRSAPKMAGSRELDWDYILWHIPLEKKAWAGQTIIDYDLDLFEEEDYQVMVTPGENYLRFNDTTYFQSIGPGGLDLNLLCMKVWREEISVYQFNQLLRDMGYSLAGYRFARRTSRFG